MATQYLSSNRSPGAVFRVSTIVALVWAISVTYCLVSVAMPLIRCIRFSAVLSAVRIDLASAVMFRICSPSSTGAPSCKWVFICALGSTVRKVCAATLVPAIVPVSLAIRVAVAFRFASPIVAMVDTSLDTQSSSSAREMMLCIYSFERRMIVQAGY